MLHGTSEGSPAAPRGRAAQSPASPEAGLTPRHAYWGDTYAASEAAIVKVIYGGVPQLLLAHGFGPGEKRASHALDEYQKNGGA